MAHRHRSPVCVQVAGAERVGAGERDSTTQTVAACPTGTAPQLTADGEGEGPAETTGMVQHQRGPARCLFPTCCLLMGPAAAPRPASGRPSTHRWGERAEGDCGAGGIGTYRLRVAGWPVAWLWGAGRARRGDESILWAAWGCWPAYGFRWRVGRRPTQAAGRRYPHRWDLAGRRHRLPQCCPPGRLRRPGGCRRRWGWKLRCAAPCPACPYPSCPPSP
mmetsp:Transcript_36832/g.105558  ORF Transcript_36832/g.105558 Transcript_36832/m.105558 type:complete len:219 (-) Transcript_36832:1678-2334(-)